MPPAFFELASVLVLSTILGIVTRALRQPLILAYIFAGIIISLSGFFADFDKEAFELFSNIGIAFLLFLVGIELRLEDLKYVGKAAVYTGIGQIAFTALVGFVIVSALGFGVVPSLYIAFALTFSSTVIIVKLLAEKHDLNSLYGKIVVGFLLIQDFVAILLLMLLSGFGASGQLTVLGVLWILVKGAFLVIFSYLSSKYALSYLFRLTSSSTELLFVAAIAWAFLLASLGAYGGFSVAIGAFLAGITIASSPYRLEIAARVKPLKDFFIVIFFILLGASMSLGAAEVFLSHIVILSLFIIIGNPLIVLAIMLTLGFRNRTSFLASVTVAQISEFSLVLMAVGLTLGHVGVNEVALVSAVGIVTIATSSYMILYADKIYRYFEKALIIILPQKSRDPYIVNYQSLSDHVILVGAEQMGWDILQFLKTKIRDKSKIIVVDFNPQIIDSVRANGFTAVFGDIGDPEVLEELNFGKAKLVVMTDPDISDASRIIKFAKGCGYKGPIVGTSYWIHDAIKLYEKGADYVVVPETVGGEFIKGVLERHWGDLAKIKKLKSRNFDELLRHKVF